MYTFSRTLSLTPPPEPINNSETKFTNNNDKAIVMDDDIRELNGSTSKELTIQKTSRSQLKDVPCFNEVISNAKLEINSDVLRLNDTPKLVPVDVNG